VTTLSKQLLEKSSKSESRILNPILVRFVLKCFFVTYEIVFLYFFFAAEGCDPNQQLLKAKGKTAMHAAAAGGYVDIMACLRLVNQ